MTASKKNTILKKAVVHSILKRAIIYNMQFSVLIEACALLPNLVSALTSDGPSNVFSFLRLALDSLD